MSGPNLDRPSSTISQSRIYLDLDDKSYSVHSPQAFLTDLDDTDVIESHNSFENIGNLSSNQDHHGEDMDLDPARKESQGNEDFLAYKFNA